MTGHDGHQHTGNDQHGGPGEHGGHDGHAERFRRLFWVDLVVGIPVVALSPMFGSLVGYSPPGWAIWVAAALGTVMYFWGGAPFLTGAVDEIRRRRPGMMLLVALAITVAFAASWAATVGVVPHHLEFWWELALLIVIMLLGHWLETVSYTHLTLPTKRIV